VSLRCPLRHDVSPSHFCDREDCRQKFLIRLSWLLDSRRSVGGCHEGLLGSLPPSLRVYSIRALNFLRLHDLRPSFLTQPLARTALARPLSRTATFFRNYPRLHVSDASRGEARPVCMAYVICSLYPSDYPSFLCSRLLPTGRLISCQALRFPSSVPSLRYPGRYCCARWTVELFSCPRDRVSGRAAPGLRIAHVLRWIARDPEDFHLMNNCVSGWSSISLYTVHTYLATGALI